ncbi:MAG: hypothetical protein ACJAVM_000671 [Sulfitobacter sp.]|jgi:hypothetical protein
MRQQDAVIGAKRQKPVPAQIGDGCCRKITAAPQARFGQD